MARIGVVKVRMPHDVQWHTGWAMRQLLRLPGLGEYRRKLADLEGKPFMPQLTLTYLAGLGLEICAQHGWRHTFEVIDDRLEYINVDGLDMLWMTVSTPNAFASYAVADRALALGIPVVLGGVHPSMMPDEAARHCTSVVVGEAEPVLAQVLEDFDAKRLQPVYRGRPVAELRSLAHPRWDLMPPDYYRWIVPVETSRGCRNACTFCSTTRMQGSRRRHRPVDDVVAEIRWLRAEGFLTADKVVFFTDNNIAYDDRDGGTTYARQLFTALRPLRIHWAGQGEIGIADDPGLVRLAVESGCLTLLVGFESLSQGNLDGVNKARSRVDSYERNIRQLHRFGVSIIGCFVFGFDDDGPEVFERTRPFIQHHIDIPQVALLTPFPGTGLHKQMARTGRLLHRDWSKYDITHLCFKPALMTPREAQEGYGRLVAQVFSAGAIIDRALRSGSRSVASGYQEMTLGGRFASVLAPNLIYKQLSLIGR